jgi:protein phosphatase
MKRRMNEDNFYADSELGLYIVADGMGGHAAGEVASRLAVQEMAKRFHALTQEAQGVGFDEAHREAFLREAIHFANDEIRKVTQNRLECSGMGTTIVAAVPTATKMIVAHVGDSRAYLFRGESLKLLTWDHSWVNEQIRRGILNEESAKTHPYRNVITQALGSIQEIREEVVMVPAQPGDLFLLCSDGLNSMVSDEQLSQIICRHLDKGLEDLSDHLIAKAKENGGDDNITVGLIQVG